MVFTESKFENLFSFFFKILLLCSDLFFQLFWAVIGAGKLASSLGDKFLRLFLGRASGSNTETTHNFTKADRKTAPFLEQI